MTLVIAISILVSVIAASTPLLLAATGELVTERSGVLNLGVEGMMLMGAVIGVAATLTTGSWFAGVVAAAAAGAAFSLIFAFLALTLRANQVASGLALTIFGTGLSAVVGTPFVGRPLARLPVLDLPVLSDLPIIGPLLFGHDVLVYGSIALLLGVGWFLNRSRPGLILRAVGESHDSAHAIGYRVVAIRYAAIAFGGMMAGLAGAHISLALTPFWAEDMTAGRGWIALALIVFASWRPPAAPGWRLSLWCRNHCPVACAGLWHSDTVPVPQRVALSGNGCGTCYHIFERHPRSLECAGLHRPGVLPGSLTQRTDERKEKRK